MKNMPCKDKCTYMPSLYHLYNSLSVKITEILQEMKKLTVGKPKLFCQWLLWMSISILRWRNVNIIHPYLSFIVCNCFMCIYLSIILSIMQCIEVKLTVMLDVVLWWHCSKCSIQGMLCMVNSTLITNAV